MIAPAPTVKVSVLFGVDVSVKCQFNGDLGVAYTVYVDVPTVTPAMPDTVTASLIVKHGAFIGSATERERDNAFIQGCLCQRCRSCGDY